MSLPARLALDLHGTPPPPAGYGAWAPPGGAGAYTPAPGATSSEPPEPSVPTAPAFAIPARGSFGLGFALGLFGPCVGIGLVHALGAGQDTKRGAAFGFGAFLALCLASQVMSALAG